MYVVTIRCRAVEEQGRKRPHRRLGGPCARRRYELRRSVHLGGSAYGLQSRENGHAMVLLSVRRTYPPTTRAIIHEAYHPGIPRNPVRALARKLVQPGGRSAKRARHGAQ